jgi:L,D-peptidoglycan transpeptidase YkuD (ErfK/YbiS/YcfS/YnhG family)
LDRLVDSHSAAVECAATRYSSAQNVSLQRKIDDLCNPEAAVQQRNWERQTRVAVHAGRRGVVQAIRLGEPKTPDGARASGHSNFILLSS